MSMKFTLSNDGGNQSVDLEGRWTFESATKLLELLSDAGAYEGWDANLENDDEEVFFAAHEKKMGWVWVAITEAL